MGATKGSRAGKGHTSGFTFRTNTDISVEKMGGREAGEEAAVELKKRRRRPGLSRAVGMDTALKDLHYPPGVLVVGVI